MAESVHAYGSEYWETGVVVPVDRRYRATVAHFEHGDLYLCDFWDLEHTVRNRQRSRCRLFVVPRVKDFVEGVEYLNIRHGLEEVLCGERYLHNGHAQFDVSLQLSSYATKQIAWFVVSGWMGPPGCAETILLPAHWETDDPEAVAMTKGYLFGDCDPHILFDWLQEHVPGNLASSFAKVPAEVLRVAPV